MNTFTKEEIGKFLKLEEEYAAKAEAGLISWDEARTMILKEMLK